LSAFDKLIISLRTAVSEENILDKEFTWYPDIFDAYRFALKYYQLKTRGIEDDDEDNDKYIKKKKIANPPQS
jgi:hypothetical protein